MSDTIINLHRKINSAADLQSVVRTMKALAASNIGQYEKSVLALKGYYRTLELGLGVCLREVGSTPFVEEQHNQKTPHVIGAIVFGSDQGLVGEFNDVVANHAIAALAELPGNQQIWAVGERVHARLTDAGLPVLGLFNVPISINAVTPLISEILPESEKHHTREEIYELHLFYNHPTANAVYTPVSQQLLPLDDNWRYRQAGIPWPDKILPEVIGSGIITLETLIREYLFVSLFRACSESLASENASRLAAMQRADQNLDELLEDLNRSYHRLNQRNIDEELFDVISGFEALNKGKK